MGYSREEVIGKKCYEIFQKSNRECHFDQFVCPVRTALETRKSCKRIMPRINREGKVVYLEISLYPIFDENNTLIHFVEISRDVSEHIHQHSEIYRQLEMLLEKKQKRNLKKGKGNLDIKTRWPPWGSWLHLLFTR